MAHSMVSRSIEDTTCKVASQKKSLVEEVKTMRTAHTEILRL